MKILLTRVVKKIFSVFCRVYEVLRFGEMSSIAYAQEGEDMVLKRIFSNQVDGFYVDIGAHHPIRFSNTYNFYKRGWAGINIEPNPDSFRLFGKYRKRDINLNYGIAKVNGVLKYHMFDEPALNTFDAAVLKSRENNTNCKYIKSVDIKVVSLKEVLNDVMPPNKKIDFLTVDVEGLDLEVLQSNDWVKFRPRWVLVEQLNLADIESLDFEIHHYMKFLNYALFAKTYNTLFYKELLTSK
jgi:FkbM family methyltransferase